MWSRQESTFACYALEIAIIAMLAIVSLKHQAIKGDIWRTFLLDLY